MLSKERIMSFGGPGLGKSFDYYTIARRAAKTGSDATFYIIDTDDSVGRMVSDPEFDVLLDDGDLTNIEVVEAYSWPEFTAAMKTVYKKMRRQDWLMIDLLTPTWSWCQGYFTENVFKSDLSDYFLKARAEMKDPKKEKAFEGWYDWPVIKNLYYEHVFNGLLRCPGNSYCTAEAKAFAGKDASKEDRQLFGPHGVMPVGEKSTGHKFQTLLWKTAPKSGQWCFTSLKDRSRPLLLAQPVKDFSIDYLVKVAKWKLA